MSAYATYIIACVSLLRQFAKTITRLSGMLSPAIGAQAGQDHVAGNDGKAGAAEHFALERDDGLAFQRFAAPA